MTWAIKGLTVVWSQYINGGRDIPVDCDQSHGPTLNLRNEKTTSPHKQGVCLFEIAFVVVIFPFLYLNVKKRCM